MDKPKRQISDNLFLAESHLAPVDTEILLEAVLTVVKHPQAQPLGLTTDMYLGEVEGMQRHLLDFPTFPAKVALYSTEHLLWYLGVVVGLHKFVPSKHFAFELHPQPYMRAMGYVFLVDQFQGTTWGWEEDLHAVREGLLRLIRRHYQ